MSGPADTYDDWLRGKPDRYEKLLRAAGHALRSYEFGNAAPDSAKEMADAIDAELASGPAQGSPAALAPPARSVIEAMADHIANLTRTTRDEVLEHAHPKAKALLAAGAQTTPERER